MSPARVCHWRHPRLGARAGRAELGLTGRRDFPQVLAQAGLDPGGVRDFGSAELEGVAHAGRALLGGALRGGGSREQCGGGDKSCIASGEPDRNHVSAPMNLIANRWTTKGRGKLSYGMPNLRPLILLFTALAVAYLLLAYVVLPFVWRHYEHQKKLDGLPMVTATGNGIPAMPSTSASSARRRTFSARCARRAGIRPIRSR